MFFFFCRKNRTQAMTRKISFIRNFAVVGVNQLPPRLIRSHRNPASRSRNTAEISSIF